MYCVICIVQSVLRRSQSERWSAAITSDAASFGQQRDHAPACKSCLGCSQGHRHFQVLDGLWGQSVATAGYKPLPGSTKLSRGFYWQRSRAGHPARRLALRARGIAPGTTAYQCSTVCIFSQLARRSTAMPKHPATPR
jgi:hypothetical protein